MRYVRYVGMAHVRQISAADWRTKGINAETVVWDAFNGFSVPLEAFNDDQIEKVIKPDASLIITGDEDDEFKPDLSATRPMTPQELEAPRVDILDPTGTENVSATGSEASTTAPAVTGRGTAGHDEP